RSIIWISLVFRVDHDGSGDLIVPALLPAVDRDPQEAEVERERGHEVADEPQREAQQARRPAAGRIDDPYAERDLSRRSAAVAPEADHRGGDDDEGEQVPRMLGRIERDTAHAE